MTEDQIDRIFFTSLAAFVLTIIVMVSYHVFSGDPNITYGQRDNEVVSTDHITDAFNRCLQEAHDEFDLD